MPQWIGRLTKRLRASEALGWDLCFFVTCLLVLGAAHFVLELVPLEDLHREALAKLHFRITYAALAIMGAKLLLHLLQLPEDGE